MHELLRHVLRERDLTRAGDVFGIPDQDIVDDLSEVIKQIIEISSSPDFSRNDHDQALIEICVTRVTSCIKETGTLDKYCAPLVALLESCLHHNLMPLGHLRDDDPPHAKIASDIISCIVLVSFPIQSDEEPQGSSSIMELFLPVAVQFLHKGNREISRHMARYLSLAATRHAILLKPHVQTIMDSIMSGNYPLCRILTNLYEVCPEPVEAHATALSSLVAHAEPPERAALFAVFGRVAARRPDALRTCLPQLLAHLCPQTAPPDDPGCMCLDLLQLVVSVSRVRAALVAEQAEALRRAARGPHASPRAVALVARALAHIGYHDKERAQEALNFALERLEGAEGACRAELKAGVQALCRAHPSLFSEHVLHAVRPKSNRPKSTLMNHSEVNRTATGVTIVKLGGATPGPPATPVSPVAPSVPHALANKGAGVVSGHAPAGVTTTTGGYTRRAKLGDSRGTGRLHPGPNPHRSMTRLNVAGGSVGGLHKSMTRLSSSQQINLQQAAGAAAGAHLATANGKPPAMSTTGTAMSTAVSTMMSRGGAVTVTTIPARPARPPHHHHNIQIGLSTSANPGPTIISGPPAVQTQSISVNPLTTGKSSDALTPVPSSVSIQQSTTALGHVSVITSTQSTSNTGPILAQNSSGPSSIPISIAGPVTVTSRRANNTSVTMINASSNTNTNSNPDSNPNHRISYFEPYPMRDTVQHFCEKHLDKIKAYMDTVSLTLPPPAKCTIEEKRSKKLVRLQFGCGWRGPHCLYARSQFSLRTRAPRVWIHLMFLALQARHSAALSSRDASVCSLKHCWDALHCDNRTFVTLVTGAFPGPKEQELVLNELQAAGFFDVFKMKRQRSDGAPLPPTHATWGCFLCTHPERAVGFLAPGPPVIEGQLKEKKGRWRLFRRWRTRYFTLSGAHLSYKGASGESIDINQIRSVKVSRGARNIPKAFEIFTGDQTLILKPKDGKDAEQWVQCLSIAVAHSQARDAPAKANSLPARGLTLKSF